MKKLKTLICILFSVLLISGMFTSCNGDATSSLVNNSVTTVISMSVDKSIAQELSDSSKLNWFIMGTKPGSDENDKLLEVVEPFSAENPSFSKEIEVTADTPVVFGLCADDEWLKSYIGTGIPVQWKITGHKINESGTAECKVEQYTKKVTLRKMELDSNTLRMTDVEKGTEPKDDLSYCILAPIAKIIGYSSVKDFTEDTSRSVAEEEIIEVPYRFLTGGEALVNKLSGGSVSLSDTENVDRFGQVKWENLVIVGTEDTDTEEEIVAKAKEGKLLVV
ncbi:MAG: hypothetical protein MJ052_04185, partial [Sphaerochaetaceae bacterium]|nr:hypothetical protein [Sphaerochaetaceae bacterium]